MSELHEAIKQIAVSTINSGKPVVFLFGVVTRQNPLQIQVDQSLFLEENQLVLTDAVRDYTTEVTFDNPEIKQVYTTWNMPETQQSQQQKISFLQPIRHEITVYNALTVGERVILCRLQQGQKFLVLDRTEARKNAANIK